MVWVSCVRGACFARLACILSHFFDVIDCLCVLDSHIFSGGQVLDALLFPLYIAIIFAVLPDRVFVIAVLRSHQSRYSRVVTLLRLTSYPGTIGLFSLHIVDGSPRLSGYRK